MQVSTWQLASESSNCLHRALIMHQNGIVYFHCHCVGSPTSQPCPQSHSQFGLHHLSRVSHVTPYSAKSGLENTIAISGFQCISLPRGVIGSLSSSRKQLVLGMQLRADEAGTASTSQIEGAVTSPSLSQPPGTLSGLLESVPHHWRLPSSLGAPGYRCWLP